MRIGVLWNKLADPKNIPRLFAFSLGIILIAGLIVPMALNPDQLYVKPFSQVQVDKGLPLAPYDRDGDPLVQPGNILPQFPDNVKSLGMVTGYMSPLAQFVSSVSPYFGTSIYSSPGGLIDEISYYTRGFDTVLDSSILMMSFIIASWLSINYTMNRRNDENEIKKDVKKAVNGSINLANEVKVNDAKARSKQLRRDN